MWMLSVDDYDVSSTSVLHVHNQLHRVQLITPQLLKKLIAYDEAQF